MVSSLHEWITKLNVQIKSIDSALEAGAQVQQLLNVECLEDYNGRVLEKLYIDFFNPLFY